jgi:hypothetical protein
MSVRFLKINRFLNTGIVLLLSNAFLYLPPMFIKVRNSKIQRAINDVNIFDANLLFWQADLVPHIQKYSIDPKVCGVFLDCLEVFEPTSLRKRAEVQR